MADQNELPFQGGATLIRKYIDNGDGTFSERVATIPVTGTSQTVDTELPAAALLADNQATPTAPTVGAALLALRSSTNSLYRVTCETDQDSLGGGILSLNVNAKSCVWNGTTFERLRTPKVFKPQSAVAIAAETAVWTPAAGKKFRFIGATIASSVAGNITFRDNNAGTIIAVVPTLAGSPTTVNFGNGILSAAANNALTAIGPAASTLSGTIFGTEE